MISQSLVLVLSLIVLGMISLYYLRKNFSERLFFKIGMSLFIILGLSNSYGLLVEFSTIPNYAIISKLSAITFNFVIAYFFYWLMNKAPASMGGAGTELSKEELSKFMEGLK